MEIAIRKEPNGLLYMDKEICQKVVNIKGETKPAFTKEQLANPPYYYTIIDVDDIYSDCETIDFDDNFTFNIDKYNTRKQAEKQVDYENKIVDLIRKKYNINQELAILRQKDTRHEEYQEYFDYVEQCKAEVKQMLSTKMS